MKATIFFAVAFLYAVVAALMVFCAAACPDEAPGPWANLVGSVLLTAVCGVCVHLGADELGDQ